MLEISIALVIIASIAGYLVNKFLDQRQQELSKTASINNDAIEVALSAATKELSKTFDDRINKTWSTISVIKEDLNAIKMQNAIKGR